jgi:hypothetical protein
MPSMAADNATLSSRPRRIDPRLQGSLNHTNQALRVAGNGTNGNRPPGVAHKTVNTSSLTAKQP